MQRSFRAPWGNELKVSTLIVMGILILGMVVVEGVGAYILAALLLASFLLFIRGYSIRDGKLIIHSFLWNKAYNLAQLTKAEAKPFVMTGAFRVLAAGGVLSYLGYYRSLELGNFLSFSTNTANTVLLEFDGKQVVVSPEDPLQFENDILLEYRRIRRI